MKAWLKKNTFNIHLIAFLLMVLPSIGLYFSVLAGSVGLTWALLGVVGLANLLILLVN
jgi:hypothetical protein